MNAIGAIGEARALLYATRRLQELLNAAGDQPSLDVLPATGYALGSVILRAVAAEVSLKALYQQETGKEPKRLHDLSKLFIELESTTQNSLEHRFQLIRKRQGSYGSQAATLHQVLITHKDDFVIGRYSLQEVGNLHIELADLEPAVQVIIEEFYSRRESIDDSDEADVETVARGL